MPWIVIPTVVVLYVAVILVQLKMGWLGVGPMLIHLVGITALVLILSKTLVKRKASSYSLLSFRAVVVTVSLLFCTISSNLALQFGQKHLFGRVWVSDTSKETYENQHGKAEEILGRQLTNNQAESFLIVQRVAHETIKVLSEEVVFRWFILGILFLALPPAGAIVTSSLLFAGMHIIFPIAISDPQLGLTRLLPAFSIGIFCGIAYRWYGLPSSAFIHLAVNLVRVFANGEYDFVVDWIAWGSAFCALVLLAPTLWFTRKREPALPTSTA